MARTITYRVKTGPGAWQRAVIDELALPQSITGLVNGTIYEVDTGKGTLVDVTPLSSFNPQSLFTGRDGFSIIPSITTSFESADNSDPAEINDGVQFQVDSSGTGTPRNLSRAELTARPLLVTSGSSTALDFEADNERHLLSGTFSPVSSANGVTLFARMRLETATGGDRHIISADDGGGAGRLFNFMVNSSGQLRLQGFTDTIGNRIDFNASAVLSTGVWYNVCAVFNATNGRLWIDTMTDAGVAATATNGAGTVNSSSGRVALGARGDFIQPLFDGLIGYALCINASLGESDRVNLATFATARGL